MPSASPHFRTTQTDFRWPDRRLIVALLVSVLAHLWPVLENFDFRTKFDSPAAPPLQAKLRPPPTPTSPLSLPEPKQPQAQPPAAAAPLPRQKPPPPPPSKPVQRSAETAPPPQTWTQVVREHLRKLDRAGEFYPRDAIAAGLQGDVDVLIVLDEAGRVVAARVERGSGHVTLDDAALKAVRALQTLPADAPRQVVLPVRFRLR